MEQPGTKEVASKNKLSFEIFKQRKAYFETNLTNQKQKKEIPFALDRFKIFINYYGQDEFVQLMNLHPENAKEIMDFFQGIKSTLDKNQLTLIEAYKDLHNTITSILQAASEIEASSTKTDKTTYSQLIETKLSPQPPVNLIDNNFSYMKPTELEAVHIELSRILTKTNKEKLLSEELSNIEECINSTNRIINNLITDRSQHPFIAVVLMDLTAIGFELEKLLLVATDPTVKANIELLMITSRKQINTFLENKSVLEAYLTTATLDKELPSDLSFLAKIIVHGASLTREECQTEAKKILDSIPESFAKKIRRYYINSKAGRLETYTFNFGDALAKDSFHIVYFYGNASSAQGTFGEAWQYVDAIHKTSTFKNIQLTIFNYPGYMYSEGLPNSMETLKQAGLAQIQQLRALRVQDGGVFCFGQSLGGAIATLVTEASHQQEFKVSLINCRSFAKISYVVSRNPLVTNIANLIIDYNEDILKAFNNIPKKYKNLIFAKNDQVIKEGGLCFALEKQYEQSLQCLNAEVKRIKAIKPRPGIFAISNLDDSDSASLQQSERNRLVDNHNASREYEAPGFCTPNPSWLFDNKTEEISKLKEDNEHNRKVQTFHPIIDMDSHNLPLDNLVTTVNDTQITALFLFTNIAIRNIQDYEKLLNEQANTVEEKTSSQYSSTI